MKVNFQFTLLLAASLMVFGCGNGENTDDQQESNEKAITTDLINNPNSANAEDVDPATLPVISFESNVYEFGQISQGEKVQHSFEFTNTGKSNLIISSASGSCGCTVPSWPKEPIPPGEKGKIDVVFDSNGKKGQQTKTVTLVANTSPNKTTLALKGEVLVPEKI